jgi:tetratricopeptide (TPR) repeat protein
VRNAFSNPADGNRAAAALAARNFATLQNMLEQQRASNPTRNGELFALEGAVAFLQGRMGDAVTDLAHAAQIEPLSDADSFTLAMALVNLGNDDRARDLLAILAQKNPDRALYIYWLGRLDYDQRRYEQAVAKFQRALKLDPQMVRAWDSLGLAFDMQGQMDQALAAFQQAVELDRLQPHPSPWPPHNLGYLLLRMERPQEAESALRESLRYDPSLAITNYHLARTLEKLGKNQEAIAYYKEAVKQDSASTDACYSLALLYRRLGREPEAKLMLAEYKRRKEAQP